MGGESHLETEYRTHQFFFKRDQVRLITKVLDGADSTECDLPIKMVKAAFCEHWEQVRPFHGLGQFVAGLVADNSEFHRPFLPSEVRENLVKSNDKLAPGPDMITKQALLNWDPEGKQLMQLYMADMRSHS